MTTRSHAVFAVASSLVVVATVTWGTILVGSPARARLARFDAQRINDLRTIVREVQSLCFDRDADDQLKRALPQTLQELAPLARFEKITLSDPESGEPYVYRKVDETTYQLCATFALPRDSDVNVFWNHSAGQCCFTVDVLDAP